MAKIPIHRNLSVPSIDFQSRGTENQGGGVTSVACIPVSDKFELPIIQSGVAFSFKRKQVAKECSFATA